MKFISNYLSFGLHHRLYSQGLLILFDIEGFGSAVDILQTQDISSMLRDGTFLFRHIWRYLIAIRAELFLMGILVLLDIIYFEFFLWRGFANLLRHSSAVLEEVSENCNDVVSSEYEKHNEDSLEEIISLKDG